MRDFFRGCDLVKFAKYVPDIDAVERDTNSARLIIDETREKEERPDRIATHSTPYIVTTGQAG